MKTQWKIPSIEELITLLNYRAEPACHLEDINPNDYYWSSSIDATDDEVGLIIHFKRGQIGGNYLTNTARLRCVRKVDGNLMWSENSPTKMTYEEALEYCKGVNNE